MNIVARLRAYAAHEDPLVAAANTVALVVAGNLPFYPVYHLFLIGWDGWPSLLEALATPLFAVVPLISRRSGLVARALPPFIGVFNALFCMKIMGQPSGNALYLVPCSVAAAMSFRTTERWLMLPLVWLPVAVFLASLDRLGAPLQPFTEAEYAAMLRLNAISTGMFVGFLGLVYGRGSPDSTSASR